LAGSIQNNLSSSGLPVRNSKRIHAGSRRRYLGPTENIPWPFLWVRRLVTWLLLSLIYSQGQALGGGLTFVSLKRFSNQIPFFGGLFPKIDLILNNLLHGSPDLWRDGRCRMWRFRDNVVIDFYFFKPIKKRTLKKNALILFLFKVKNDIPEPSRGRFRIISFQYFCQDNSSPKTTLCKEKHL